MRGGRRVRGYFPKVLWMRLTSSQWWLLLLGMVVGATAAAEDSAASPPQVITSIRFVGNENTRPEILLQEIKLRVGDVPAAGAMNDARQAIMNLGLFTAVELRVEPDDHQGQTLVIEVREKRFVLPIPKIDRDVDGNIRAGVQLRLDNVQGLNQRIRVNYQEEDKKDLDARAKTFSTSYDYPRILGTPLSFSAGVGDSRTPETVDEELGDGSYVSHEQSVRFGISRLLDPEGPTWGWMGGVGLGWSKQTIDERDGDTSSVSDQRRVGVTLSLSNTRLNDYLYSREGHDYGVGFEFGFPALGSQGAYTRTGLYWRSFLLVTERAHTVLATQLAMGFSSGYLFGDQYAYSIGGGNSLRGYPPDSFEGNTFLLANVEVHSPLVAKHPALQGLVFVDFGSAYPDGNDIDSRDMHSSGGVGLRWKLKTFVNIDLRVDYARSFDDGDYKFLAGTKEVF